jgi:hypothetical protein
MLVRRASIANPVSDENEDGGSHQGQFRTFMDDNNNDGRHNDEREQECRADPIDCRRAGRIVGSSLISDWGECKPLCGFVS